MVRVVVLVAAVALVLPASADAALTFAFDRAQARPGQMVRAFQADADGNPMHVFGDFDATSVSVYLLRTSHGPGTPRPLLLGPMQMSSDGVWFVTFHVPRVQPGLYTTGFLCGPCGNTFFASTLPGTRWTRTPSRVLKVLRARR